MLGLVKVRFLITSAICWCLSLALPAMAGDSGFILSQKSGVCGDAEIYASSKGLKLVQKGTSCILVMRAPDWKVNFFNTDSKVHYETDAKNFQGKSSGFLAGLISASRFLALSQEKTKASATSVAGLNCTETKLVRIGALPAYTIRNKNELMAATYYGTRDLALPQPAVLVLQRFYRIPTLTGFPAKVDIFDLKGRVKTELDTCSCVKSVLAPSTFNIPTGYAKVESEEAVVASHQQGLLQDMSEDLGVKFGSHK